MTYLEQFPYFFSYSLNKQDAFWNRQFIEDDAENLYYLLKLLEDEYVLIQGDMDRVQEVGRAFVQDCINGYKFSGSIIFNYLQFAGSTFLAYYFVNIKVPGYMYDWLTNSLTDSLEPEQQKGVIYGRIHEFILSGNEIIQQNLDEILSMWTYCLFLYSRVYGGLTEIAMQYLDFYLKYFLTMPRRGNIYFDYIQSLCQIYSFTRQNHRNAEFQKVAHYLNLSYQATEIPDEWKMLIALEFSCIDEISGGISKIQWCALILEKYRHLLKGHQELQVLINYYGQDVNQILQHLTEIKEAARNYREFIEKSGANKSLLNYELNEIYGLMLPAVITLVKGSQIIAVNELIGIFFNIPKEKLIRDRVLHIIPNDLSGIVLSNITDVHTIFRNPFELIRKLTKSINEFLSTTLTLRDDTEFVLVMPERHGVPNPNLGPDFENLMNEQFIFTDGVPDNLFFVNGYVFHFGFNVPLQPILLRQKGFTLPMSYSFQQPSEQRPFKKAYIWQGDSMFAQLECTGIKVILEQKGIAVTLVNGETTPVSNFIQSYECDEYDLIWLSGHGDFQHFEPHKSFIQLYPEKNLTIQNLANLKCNWKNRRLIFLNICDGATTSLFNSPVSLGIGHYLVHGQQSLLSHLWPIQPAAAMVIAWLIATFVEADKTYIEIYSQAIQIFRKGNSETLAFLRSFISNNEMLERLENISFDFKNFYYWGSLTLLQ